MMNEKRVSRRYADLDDKTRAVLKDHYPDGFAGHVFKVSAGNDYFWGMVFKHEGKEYLIRFNKDWKKETGFVNNSWLYD